MAVLYSQPINIIRYTNGTMVKLTASRHEFVSYDYDPETQTGTFLPDTITIKATLSGALSLKEWQYSNSGDTFSKMENVEGVTISGLSVVISPDSALFRGSDTVTIRAVASDDIHDDTVTISRIVDPKIVYNKTYTSIEQTNDKIALIASQEQLAQLSTEETFIDKYSAFVETANGFEQTVRASYATKNYADSSASTAASGAVTTANAYTDGKLRDYSTKAEMESSISQTASQITQSVSQTYATKTYADTQATSAASSAQTAATNAAKGYTDNQLTGYATKGYADSAAQSAQTGANGYTDNKLGGYLTATQTRSEIEQKAGEITQTVQSIYATKEEMASATDGMYTLETPYQYNNQAYTFEAKIYKNAGDVTSSISAEHIEWWKRSENYVDEEFVGTGKTITVTEDSLGYGGTVVCRLIIVSDEEPLTTETDAYITEEHGEALTAVHAVAELSTETTLYRRDYLKNQFAQIKVTTDSITSSVQETLQNYSTTSEMNSVIEQKAGEITQSVSSNYVTKADGITSVVVQYAKGTSSTTAPESGWSTGSPTWEDGKYIWQRTAVTKDGTTSYSNVSCIQGAKGNTGDPGAAGKGISSIVNYYLASAGSSGVTRSTSGWTTTVQNTSLSKKYLWNYEKLVYTDSTETYTTPCIIGTYGESGSNGKGISSITNYYLASASSSGVTKDTSGWTTTVQSTSTTKRYLWNYEKITYTDNSKSYTSPCIIGTHGETGATGKGISSIAEYYAINNSTTAPADNSFSTTVKTPTSTNKYLWNYELITYTDNTTSKTEKRIIGTYGETGSTGKGISSIVEYYAINNSTTAPADSSFSTTVKSPTSANKYLWNYELITYSDSTTTKTGKRIIGTYGETGSAGKGVKAVKAQYYLSTSASSCTGGNWSDVPPTWVSGKYLWTRTHVTYTDDTTSITTAVIDQITNALEQRMSSAELKITDSAIISTVTSGTGAEAMVSAINQTASDIQIEAQHINLVGAVTMDDLSADFAVLELIEAGEIKAVKIDLEDLFAQNIIASGTITGLTLSGATVEADEGYIGNWIIDEDGFLRNESGTVFLSSTQEAAQKAGYPTDAYIGINGFLVDGDGNPYATNTYSDVYNVFAKNGTDWTGMTLQDVYKPIIWSNNWQEAGQWNYELCVGDADNSTTEGSAYFVFRNGKAYLHSGNTDYNILTYFGRINTTKQALENVQDDISDIQDDLSGKADRNANESFSGLTVTGTTASKRVRGNTVVYDAAEIRTDSPNTLSVNQPAISGYTAPQKLYKTSSSSKRYKDHVSSVDFEQAKKVLDIPVVNFKYKDGYLAKDDELNGKPMPGLYAEDVEKLIPEAVYHLGGIGGEVENWKERIILPLLLRVVQEQQKEIDELKNLIKEVHT